LDLNTIIRELKDERDRVGRAIDALDGSSPVFDRSARGLTKSHRQRRGLTAAGRRRLSEAMKRRWAERRAGKQRNKAKTPKRRGGLTPAGRKKLSEAMKRRWAERRKSTS
jgi:hypothetical protein